MTFEFPLKPGDLKINKEDIYISDDQFNRIIKMATIELGHRSGLSNEQREKVLDHFKSPNLKEKVTQSWFLILEATDNPEVAEKKLAETLVDGAIFVMKD